MPEKNLIPAMLGPPPWLVGSDYYDTCNMEDHLPNATSNDWIMSIYQIFFLKNLDLQQDATLIGMYLHKLWWLSIFFPKSSMVILLNTMLL